METRSLFYRKDLARAAGVSAPKTWQEYGPFLKALQKEGAKWGLSLPTGVAQSWQSVLPFMWQAGAHLMNEDGTEFTLTTPEALEGMKFYQSFFTSKTASRNGPVSLGEIEPQFVDGSTAALIAGPWETALLKEAGGADFVKDKVGVVALPKGPESNMRLHRGRALVGLQGGEEPRRCLEAHPVALPARRPAGLVRTVRGPSRRAVGLE